MTAKIALFASGSGTNAENIIKTLGADCVALLVASKAGIGAIGRAQRLGVDTVVWDKQYMAQHAHEVVAELRRRGVSLIVLAGYLLHVPDYLLEAYPDAIINIHPSLLPRHGGKGMYGHHVHQDVLDCGDAESGITIHRVNAIYDSGEILFQAKCPVMSDDTPDTLAARVHALEYEHFPTVVRQCLQQIDR